MRVINVNVITAATTTKVIKMNVVLRASINSNVRHVVQPILPFHTSDLAPAAAGCPSQNWPGPPRARAAAGETVEKFSGADGVNLRNRQPICSEAGLDEITLQAVASRSFHAAVSKS